jgi:hypothetical protein
MWTGRDGIRAFLWFLVTGLVIAGIVVAVMIMLYVSIPWGG